MKIEGTDMIRCDHCDNPGKPMMIWAGFIMRGPVPGIKGKGPNATSIEPLQLTDKPGPGGDSRIRLDLCNECAAALCGEIMAVTAKYYAKPE